MGSKVCTDWLPSHIKATGTDLEILKTDGYFPDSPRNGRGLLSSRTPVRFSRWTQTREDCPSQLCSCIQKMQYKGSKIRNRNFGHIFSVCLTLRQAVRLILFFFRTVHCNIIIQYEPTKYILVIKPTRCTNFFNLFLE